MSVFGTMILPGAVQDAVKGVFVEWMDTYLREMERRTGRSGGALPAIKDWSLLSDADGRFPEQQLPGVLITWSELPLTTHADDVSGSLDVSVEVMVQSTDFVKVRDLAGVYVFALGLIALQKMPRHGMFASVTTPQLALPAAKAVEQRRWRAVATVDFTVEIDGVMSTVDGPVEQAPDPTPVPPDTPTAETVEATAALTLQ